MKATKVMNTPPLTCPLCKNRLYWRKSGWVCKNHTCSLYWKGGGWSCFESNHKLWIYTDSQNEQDTRWDILHGYPPRKTTIAKRHIIGMKKAFKKDEDLCFVFPTDILERCRDD